MNNWIDKRGVLFAPFCDLNSCFENSSRALYQDNGRILLEDVILLKPGKTVACIISDHRYILSRNQVKAKQMRDIFKDTMIYNPFKPVQFGRKIFFALSSKVHLNVHYTDFNVS